MFLSFAKIKQNKKKKKMSERQREGVADKYDGALDIPNLIGKSKNIYLIRFDTVFGGSVRARDSQPRKIY